MKFGEKIRAARLKRGFSQKELAGKAHIALRTIQNYESGERMPKSKETYAALARALDISEEMLRDEEAEFILEASRRYGERGEKQARALVEQVAALYAGGELAEEDMDAMAAALQEAYWQAKQINRKYVPKKYRRSTEENGD